MYTDAFFRWPELTSSGASTVVYDNPGLRTCRNVTIVAETQVDADTAVIAIEHARTSTSPFVRLGSTAYALASSAAPEAIVIQLTGPLFAIRPFVISKTASTTVVNIALIGA